MNAPAIGDTAILGSLIGFNCVPNFMAADNNKDTYIEKKLIIEFTLLQKIIGGANGVIRVGLNDVNNTGVGVDAVYVQQNNIDTRVIVRDNAINTEIITAESPDKIHIEICSNYIEFYFGTILINRFEAGLPDDFMYLWFWVDDNATVRLGPILSWYEKVDIERV